MLVHTHVLVLFDDQVGDGNDDGDEGYEIKKKKKKRKTRPPEFQLNCGLQERERGRERRAILGGRASEQSKVEGESTGSDNSWSLTENE